MSTNGAAAVLHLPKKNAVNIWWRDIETNLNLFLPAWDSDGISNQSCIKHDVNALLSSLRREQRTAWPWCQMQSVWILNLFLFSAIPLPTLLFNTLACAAEPATLRRGYNVRNDFAFCSTRSILFLVANLQIDFEWPFFFPKKINVLGIRFLKMLSGRKAIVWPNFKAKNIVIRTLFLSK